MSEASTSAQPTPWYFWVIAVVALLWNGYGGYDYWMTQTAGDAYLRTAMTEPQIAYFHAMPGWMTGVWALGVWGGVAGSLLLLLRSRWAVAVFVASLAGLLISLIYHYVLSNGLEVMGSSTIVLNVVITAAALFFIWFSRRMARRGVLR